MTRFPKSAPIAPAALALLALLALLPQAALAHCQVPCWIYDDAARIDRMVEDATTIEKAMTMMQELAPKSDAQSGNQFARWVATKEQHAANVIETVSEYFLTQKVKPVAAGEEGYQAYLETLADHHRVMTAAMQAKQNADPAFAAALRQAIAALAARYDAGHAH